MAGRFSYAKAEASSRRGSEDRAEILECEDGLIAVIADGAGGMRGGGAASDALVVAVRSIRHEAAFDPWNAQVWCALLARVDEGLATKLAGETTAVVVVVGARGLLGVSVGDSEAWVVDDVRVDVLTEHQDRKRLGIGRASSVVFRREKLEGTLVVATDGLFKCAPRERIVAACVGGGLASDVATALTGLPKLRSGAYPDDVAVVVIAGSGS